MFTKSQRYDLLQTIIQIEHFMQVQQSIDEFNDKRCEVIYNYLSGKVIHIGMKNRFSYGESMRKRRNYTLHRGSRGIESALGEEYSNARDTFDKALRRTEVVYK